MVPGPGAPGSELNPEKVSRPFQNSGQLGQLVWEDLGREGISLRHGMFSWAGSDSSAREMDRRWNWEHLTDRAAEQSSQTKVAFPLSVSPSLASLLCLPWPSGGHLMSPLPPSPGPRPPAKTPLLLPSSVEATTWPSRLQNPA